MSENVLKISLEELKTIQIVCLGKKSPTAPHCGAVLEIPVSKVAEVEGGEIRCPLCNTVFYAPRHEAIGRLVGAMAEIAQRSDELAIRFVIPQPAE